MSKLPHLDEHLAKESSRVIKAQPPRQQRVKVIHERLNRSAPSGNVYVTALDEWDALEGDWNNQAPKFPHVLPRRKPWCFQECNHKHE